MSTPSDAKKMLILRKLLGHTQSRMGEFLDVSPALIGAIERGEKSFTQGLKELSIAKFGLRREWLMSGEGEPFGEAKPTLPKLSKSAKGIIFAVGIGAILPTTAAAIALGIGTNEVLKKIAKAYGAENIKELAQKNFKISPAAVSGWIKRNRIPEEYLAQAINDKKITLEELVSNDEYVMIRRMDLMEVIKKMCEGQELQNLKPSDLIEIFDAHVKGYQKPS